MALAPGGPSHDAKRNLHNAPLRGGHRCRHEGLGERWQRSRGGAIGAPLPDRIGHCRSCPRRIFDKDLPSGRRHAQVLKLTTFDGGVRVDYEFVVSGRATWTNMNRPLLRQFGIRAAGTFCLPRDTRIANESDYD